MTKLYTSLENYIIFNGRLGLLLLPIPQQFERQMKHQETLAMQKKPYFKTTAS